MGWPAAWEWLNKGESGSATVRTVAVVVGIPLAITFATWRTLMSERGQQSHRYRTAAEMLGGDTLIERLGGVYALRRLALEYPKGSHVEVMRLLADFVRYPTAAGDSKH